MFGMMGGLGMMGGGMFMMLFWVLIIIGVIYLFSRGNQTNSNQHYSNYDNNSQRREKKAQDIARERYARGEINKQELEEILQALNS